MICPCVLHVGIFPINQRLCIRWVNSDFCYCVIERSQGIASEDNAQETLCVNYVRCGLCGVELSQNSGGLNWLLPASRRIKLDVEQDSSGGMNSHTPYLTKALPSFHLNSYYLVPVDKDYARANSDRNVHGVMVLLSSPADLLGPKTGHFGSELVSVLISCSKSTERRMPSEFSMILTLISARPETVGKGMTLGFNLLHACSAFTLM